MQKEKNLPTRADAARKVIRSLRGMDARIPVEAQVIGFDGVRMFGGQEPIVSAVVQPVLEIAEAWVSAALFKRLSYVPSLICLQVQYAYGGTTKE